MPASPPANAVKKNSGKAIDGISSALFVKKLCSIRHATPSATASVLTSAPASAAAPTTASAIATTAISRRDAEPERERLARPSRR